LSPLFWSNEDVFDSAHVSRAVRRLPPPTIR
jgi:hypothetical protein